jgi:hypothetical protein
MKRRDILKYTAYVTGAALSAPLLLSLESCKSDDLNIDYSKLSFFDKDQFRLASSIADTILPKTDTPSASEVGVPMMIDHMVAHVYTEESRATYSEQFAQLTDHMTRESGGVDFHRLDEEKRKAILVSLSSSENDALANVKRGLLELKQQTIAYYLNTEEVATKFLNYLPVPGPFEGCISLESVGGKAWAI